MDLGHDHRVYAWGSVVSYEPLAKPIGGIMISVPVTHVPGVMETVCFEIFLLLVLVTLFCWISRPVWKAFFLALIVTVLAENFLFLIEAILRVTGNDQIASQVSYLNRLPNTLLFGDLAFVGYISVHLYRLAKIAYHDYRLGQEI